MFKCHQMVKRKYISMNQILRGKPRPNFSLSSKNTFLTSRLEKSSPTTLLFLPLVNVPFTSQMQISFLEILLIFYHSNLSISTNTITHVHARAHTHRTTTSPFRALMCIYRFLLCLMSLFLPLEPKCQVNRTVY